MDCLGRDHSSVSPGRMLQCWASTLVGSGDFRISEDANPVWFDDCGGTKIHIDAARCDQQVNVVMLGDILDPLKRSRRKIPGSACTAVLIAWSNKSGHAGAVESQIVLQKLDVSLEDPVNLR